MFELILLSLILALLVMIGVVQILLLKRIRSIDVNNRSIYTLSNIIKQQIQLNQDQLRAVVEQNGFDWVFPAPDFGAQHNPLKSLAGQRLMQKTKFPKLEKLMSKKVQPNPAPEAEAAEGPYTDEG